MILQEAPVAVWMDCVSPLRGNLQSYERDKVQNPGYKIVLESSNFTTDKQLVTVNK